MSSYQVSRMYQVGTLIRFGWFIWKDPGSWYVTEPYRSQAASWGQRTGRWGLRTGRRSAIPLPQSLRPSQQCSLTLTGTSWFGSTWRPSTRGPSACGRWPPGWAASPEAASCLKKKKGLIKIPLIKNLIYTLLKKIKFKKQSSHALFNSRPFTSIKSSNSLPNRFTYIYINCSSL